MDSPWQTDRREVIGGGGVRVVQRCPLSCRGGNEVWTRAASGHPYGEGDSALRLTHNFFFFSFSGKFDWVTLCLEKCEKIVQKTSLQLSFTCAAHALMLFLFLSQLLFSSRLSLSLSLRTSTSGWCIKPAGGVTEEGEGGLWDGFTTWLTIFRLESRLCLYFLKSDRETHRYRHNGAFVLLAQTKTLSTSDVFFHHTDTLQHVQAQMGLS